MHTLKFNAYDTRVFEELNSFKKTIYITINCQAKLPTYNRFYKKSMIEDANIQKLIKEGVHEDIVLNRGRFESCNMCGLRYGKTLKPLLLNCGHFICLQCLNEQNRCGYPACKNTSPTIKNKNINTANADSNAN